MLERDKTRRKVKGIKDALIEKLTLNWLLAVTEEEFLRMERKRKQMEKQAEFKRFMIEKGQQKTVECKKPCPKY